MSKIEAIAPSGHDLDALCSAHFRPEVTAKVLEAWIFRQLIEEFVL
jgi:hypothetical protein